MAAQRIDGLGAGVGQPHRLDLQSQAHLDRLNPSKRLDIPDASIGGARNQPQREAGERGGWARLDQTFDELGSDWSAGRQGRWEQFAGGRRTEDGRPRAGAVAIDGPQRREPAPPRQEAGPLTWDLMAAELEEWAREHGERIGAETGLKLPGHLADETQTNVPAAPGGDARAARNGRRPFRVG